MRTLSSTIGALLLCSALAACDDDSGGKDGSSGDGDGGITQLDSGSGDGEDAAVRDCEKYDGYADWDWAAEGKTPPTDVEANACIDACAEVTDDAAFDTCLMEQCTPAGADFFACANTTLIVCLTNVEGPCHAEFDTNVCCEEETCSGDATCAEQMCGATYDTMIQCALDNLEGNTAAANTCRNLVFPTCTVAAPDDAGTPDAGSEDAGTPDAGSDDAGIDGGTTDAGTTNRPTVRARVRPLRATRVHLAR